MSLVQNAAVLVAGQLVSKLFTFSLNQLLLSYTSPSALGVSQLIEFVLDYTFFLSREALRLTIAKLPATPQLAPARLQWTVNYSFLTFVIYLVLGTPIVYWKIVCNDHNIFSLLGTFSVHHVVTAIALCVVCELLAESYYNVNQYVKLDFKTRTKIESLAGFVRCIVQFLAVVLVAPRLGLQRSDIDAYVFGYLAGQLSYSFAIFVLYWYSFSFQIFKPKRVQLKGSVSAAWFEPASWKYFQSIFVQQLFKNFLTVGDRFVTTSLLPIQTQGYYSFISNYGSLIARILFAPLEESTRITIGSFFKDTSADGQKEREDFRQLALCLANVSKIYTYLLTLLVVFAPLNTRFLLSLVFRNFNSDEVVSAFKIYWVYVLLLALNGILEALFQSLFHSKEIVNRHSIFMFVNSVVFLSSLVLLIAEFDYGLNGLILANMVNMAMRIVYCWQAVHRFIREKAELLQTPFYLNMSRFTPFLAAAFLLSLFQYTYFHGEVTNWKQFLLSALCGVALVFLVLVNEVFIPRMKRKHD